MCDFCLRLIHHSLTACRAGNMGYIMRNLCGLLRGIRLLCFCAGCVCLLLLLSHSIHSFLGVNPLLQRFSFFYWMCLHSRFVLFRDFDFNFCVLLISVQRFTSIKPFFLFPVSFVLVSVFTISGLLDFSFTYHV